MGKFKNFLLREKSLSAANFKIYPERLYTFRQKILNAEPFETSLGDVIVLNTPENIKLVDDIAQGRTGRGIKFSTDAGLLALNAFHKTSDFGGLGGRSGKLSRGIDNEMILLNTINQFASAGPINVIFQSKSKKFSVKNVTRAEHVGSDTKNRKKSDINLITIENKTVPISIKKNNAEGWESADKTMGKTGNEILLKAINDGIIKLTTGSTTRMSSNIAFEATPKEKLDVVFGSDIYKGHGAVIQKTFGAHSFELKGSDLFIEVTEIITSLKDLTKFNNVWFIIRHDRTRNNKLLGFKGLRILATYENRINKNVIRIKR